LSVTERLIMSKTTARTILRVVIILFLSGCHGTSTKENAELVPNTYFHTGSYVPPSRRVQESNSKSRQNEFQKTKKSIQSQTIYDRTEIVYKQLDQVADLSALTPQMSFRDALDLVRNAAEPRLNIVVLWKDLSENAYIDADTPVGIEGVPGIPLRRSLELLLTSVSAGSVELDFVVEDGIIIIATKDSLPTKFTTRLYDVTDLTGRPADYYVQTGGGAQGGGGGRRNR